MERPILFSGPMVRAILEGRKTQTRRVVNPPPSGECSTIEVGVYHPTKVDGHGEEYPGDPIFGAYTSDGAEGWKSPCEPGDVLWVRETWAAPHAYDHLPPRLIPEGVNIHYAAAENLGGLLRRPSIFMPRWAARIFLRVTAVRFEKLQSISAADALAEGVDPPEDLSYAPLAFSQLWDSINVERGYGWETNPWVWVIAFKRIGL